MRFLISIRNDNICKKVMKFLAGTSEWQETIVLENICHSERSTSRVKNLISKENILFEIPYIHSKRQRAEIKNRFRTLLSIISQKGELQEGITVRPKGNKATRMSLKCWIPNGMPTIVIQKSNPQPRWLNAIQMPPIKNQITFMMISRQLRLPSSTTVVWLKGKRATNPILKTCNPKGIPMMVQHNKKPDTLQFLYLSWKNWNPNLLPASYRLWDTRPPEYRA